MFGRKTNIYSSSKHRKRGGWDLTCFIFKVFWDNSKYISKIVPKCLTIRWMTKLEYSLVRLVLQEENLKTAKGMLSRCCLGKLFTILICCVMLSCGKSSLAFLFQRFQLASAYQLIDSSCCCMNFSISWRDHLYFFINSSGGFSSNFLVSLCFDVRILLLFLSLDISWCLLTWHWL